MSGDITEWNMKEDIGDFHERNDGSGECLSLVISIIYT